MNENGYAGRRVTVMGLGRFGGGVGVTRWLAEQGARVTVSDAADAEALGKSIAALSGLDVTLHLGAHEPADFTETDLVVVNPAVPFDSEHVAAARAAGVELTTEINLFLARCRGIVAGVTGSAGKSTTTAMIGEIVSTRMVAHVGGNIGRSLLAELPEIGPEDVVVLELSSFQLHYLPLLGRSPHVAVVTNLHENHLDRHATMEHYAAAKKNVFRFQTPEDTLVLNADDPAVAGWAVEAPGRVEMFSADDEPFELLLPGRHNQANAQAAFAAGRALGVDRPAAAEALKRFAGLPHRMQLVAEIDGVRYYNDSKCTTPTEALAVLEAFPPRSMVVIVGGYDKKSDLGELCRTLAQRAKGVVATGDTGERIARGVEQAGEPDGPIVVRARQFDAAVHAARGLAQPGDMVLLAPACASFDQFANYERRGERFIALVRERH